MRCVPRSRPIMAKPKSDQQKRAARAVKLRASIARVDSGKPQAPKSPREMTDDAARQAWREAEEKTKPTKRPR